MTDAIECDRCKKVTTEVYKCERFATEGELARLLSVNEKRLQFDLCPDCDSDLEDVLMAWWDHNLKR